LDKQHVIFSDWGKIDYKSAWDKQEGLLLENVEIKTAARKENADQNPLLLPTTNHLIFCEHSAVYTLGKSGNISNVLLSDEELFEKGIEFYKTNRGGDITFHGEGQIVGYPILDLEKFQTDIGVYLRNIEEVIIKTIAAFGIKGERSSGETGVWIDNEIPGKERKICAIGVRCSRWITMHGFALNVNTDLDYFQNIIPCGIQDKKVTSINKEIGFSPELNEVKELIKKNFESVFNAELI
jgi:lipoyl(octanoyl) transferase